MSGHRNVILNGTGIAPGAVLGRAFVYHDVLEEELPAAGIRADQVESECARVDRAAEQVKEDLDQAIVEVRRQIGSYRADIFKAQQYMLREILNPREVRREIEQGLINAETAVQHIFNRWVQMMQGDEEGGFPHRADDVADLGRRMVRNLRQIIIHPLAAVPQGRVLVASKLLPSDAVFFAVRGAAGIIVETGGAETHFAILTRRIGIPAVSNVPGATRCISPDELVVVDGTSGTVIVDPDEAAGAGFQAASGGADDT